MGVAIKDSATIDIALPLPFNCLDFINPMIASTMPAIRLMTLPKPPSTKRVSATSSKKGFLCLNPNANAYGIIIKRTMQSMLHTKLHVAHRLLVFFWGGGYYP